MAEQGTSISIAEKMMSEFARLTGLSGANSEPRRYLWTDAFAVCNFLGLYQETEDEKFKDLALRLVDQVHSVLGHHRNDDSRTGWLSGLDDEEGRLHPTRAGLRIGKELKERGPNDPMDEQLEWDRDGQYYHYLTKWMHALDRVTRVTSDFTFNRWAIELAKAVHARFVCPSPSGRRKSMYWKMSIDLSYPLVTSMGLHDPLDGLVTYTQLKATSATDPERSSQDLKHEIADMVDMCKGRRWATDDPLGIGGLLSDAFRVAQLMTRGYFTGMGLLAVLLDASLKGLEWFDRENFLNLPAEYRLAFRELGLSIGLGALERLSRFIERNEDTFAEKEMKARINPLKEYGLFKEVIDNFWLEPQSRETRSWMAHRDINTVMLATSLSPVGFLTL
jgi:hypothetical protein